jgi:hypothetical protein
MYAIQALYSIVADLGILIKVVIGMDRALLVSGGARDSFKRCAFAGFLTRHVP